MRSVESKPVLLLSGSPDSICAVSDDKADVSRGFFVVKTVTAVRTVQKAMDLKKDYSSLTYVHKIGKDASVLPAFHELVPRTAYGLQVLHHSELMKKPLVVFGGAHRSQLGVGGIIYAVVIHFSEQLIAEYIHCLSCLRESAFT